MESGRNLTRWVVMVAAALAVSGSDIERRVAAVAEATPVLARTHWGALAVRVDTGEVVYAHNARKLFTPASNTKLYSAAVALLKLGADYRFRTTLGTVSPVDSAGRTTGDLVLAGGGDPSISARVFPYRKGAANGDALAIFDQMAEAAFAAGLRRVDGDIVGDDTRWPFAPFVSSWAIGDAVFDSGAPVSALSVNDNFVTLTLEAGKMPGDPVSISLRPPVEHFWFDNRLITAPGKRDIDIERPAGTRQIQLRGTMPPGSTFRDTLAIDDPALYAAKALYDALTRRGVSVNGQPRARHRQAGEPHEPLAIATLLHERQSPPLAEIAQIVSKVSQNLYAEMILREAAFGSEKDATAEGGLAAVEALLAGLGLSSEDHDFHDGSGLSRMGLTSPEATVTLLRHMWWSPVQAPWLSSLPIGGEDGSLASRFAKSPNASRVRAKTGSLRHVAALGGYVDSKTHGMLAFCVMLNGFNTPFSEATAAIDKITLEFAK